MNQSFQKGDTILKSLYRVTLIWYCIYICNLLPSYFIAAPTMSPASTAEIDTFQQQQCVYIEEKKELIFFLFFFRM